MPPEQTPPPQPPPADVPPENPLPSVDDHEGLDLDRDSSSSAPPVESSPPPSDTGFSGESEAPSAAPVETSIPAAAAPSDTKAPVLPLVSLITGILGIITCVGFILFSPAAIITGHMGMGKGKKSPVQPFPGKKLALVGLILGYLGLVGGILTLLLWALGFVGTMQSGGDPGGDDLFPTEMESVEPAVPGTDGAGNGASPFDDT